MSTLSQPMQLILTLVKTQGQVLKPLESSLNTHPTSHGKSGMGRAGNQRA